MNIINDESFIRGATDQVFGFLSRYCTITEKDKEVFQSQLEFIEIDKNEIFSKQGDIENYMYCIFEGAVRKFAVSEEKEYTLGFHFPVSFFSSYTSFIMQVPSNLNMQTLTKVILCRISAKNMAILYATAPNAEKIGRKMIELAYIDREQKDIKLQVQGAKNNYLDLLVSSKDLIQKIPQKYIASYIGITPQSLSRIRKNI